VASASPVSCRRLSGCHRRTSRRRNASAESPAPCPDPRGAAGDRRSRRDAPLRVLSSDGAASGPRSRSQAAGRFAVMGSAAPRAGGRLSAAAGCAEHTVQWSPTVTTPQSTRLSEPWRSARLAAALVTTPSRRRSVSRCLPAGSTLPSSKHSTRTASRLSWHPSSRQSATGRPTGERHLATGGGAVSRLARSGAGPGFAERPPGESKQGRGSMPGHALARTRR
jgi:hypothetical protein